MYTHSKRNGSFKLNIKYHAYVKKPTSNRTGCRLSRIKSNLHHEIGV
jgi:hypothetical protein